MKKKIVISVLAAVLVTAASVPVLAAGPSVISAGARYHVDHSVCEELPFGDGDVSYGLAYEYHEESGYWQIAMNYTPDITGTNLTDYVITPQINLIFKDRMWRGGIGALRSYVRDVDNNGDWTDMYWQMLAGIHLPLFGLKLDVHAYYVFEKWNELDEFDSEDIEFGAWLKFSF